MCLSYFVFRISWVINETACCKETPLILYFTFLIFLRKYKLKRCSNKEVPVKVWLRYTPFNQIFQGRSLCWRSLVVLKYFPSPFYHYWQVRHNNHRNSHECNILEPYNLAYSHYSVCIAASVIVCSAVTHYAEYQCGDDTLNSDVLVTLSRTFAFLTFSQYYVMY